MAQLASIRQMSSKVWRVSAREYQAEAITYIRTFVNKVMSLLFNKAQLHFF